MKKEALINLIVEADDVENREFSIQLENAAAFEKEINHDEENIYAACGTTEEQYDAAGSALTGKGGTFSHTVEMMINGMTKREMAISLVQTMAVMQRRSNPMEELMRQLGRK